MTVGSSGGGSGDALLSGHQLRLAWTQWQGLARALPQWLLQQHVASQADAAVGAGAETPYQVRLWDACAVQGFVVLCLTLMRCFAYVFVSGFV
jgi:hypothetical protein